MMTLSQEQANTAWAQFYGIFERTGLSSYYDMDKLKNELLASPCALTEDMGTAYKGALLMHINMTCALAQRTIKMISGTFQIDEDSILKVSQKDLCMLKMIMNGRLKTEGFFLSLQKIWKDV